MTLPAVLDAGLQALGIRPKAATSYDLALLRKALAGTDSLGRLPPAAYQMLGGEVSYLAPETQKLRERLVGQFGLANQFFAKKAAAIPWTLWHRGQGGKPEQLPYDSPLLELLWRPNPMMSAVQFMRAVSTLYHGEGVVPIWANLLDSGPRKGQPQELWILPPHAVKPQGGSLTTPVTHYRYTPDSTRPGEYIDLEPAELLFLRNGALPGEISGTSTATAAFRQLTTDKSTSDAQNSLMQNQGPPGLLSFPPQGDTAITLSAPTIADIRARFDTSYTGPANRGRIPIVTEKVEYTSTGATAVDLAILQLRTANFREICGWFGFSAVLLGDMEASTDNNYQNARKALYTDALLPYLEDVVTEFSTWLCPKYEAGSWLQVDLSGIQELQVDKKATAEWLALCPFIRVERKAEIMGEAADDNFKGYLIPAGLDYVPDPKALAQSQKQMQRYQEYPGAEDGG